MEELLKKLQNDRTTYQQRLAFLKSNIYDIEKQINELNIVIFSIEDTIKKLNESDQTSSN